MTITRPIELYGFMVLMVTLTISCANKGPTDHEIATSSRDNSTSIDTLKFTSGIRSIFQDKYGNYWFGSLQEGIAMYDGSEFTYFTANEGLHDNQIRDIDGDETGRVWISTAHGICSYDGDSITNHTPSMSAISQGDWSKSEHDLWFNGGNQRGVFQYDGTSVKFLAFPEPVVHNPYNVYFVTGISQGSSEMVWIATYAGLFGYNGSEFTIINDQTLNLSPETGELHIRSILEDSEGRLWIGNNGIGVFLKENDSIYNFSKSQGLMHPAASFRSTSERGDLSPPGTLEHVFTLTEDGSGNIWFGDRDGGIWKYDGQTMYNYTESDGLAEDFALSIYEDRSGNLWFGMANGEVYTFNGNSFDRKH
ncbi:MAG: diguanylate cyclase [Flavobacteriia bacterium]|nr:diguanylate cyclase [Flavobacteriia bacterium]